jgi:hypothetical protein
MTKMKKVINICKTLCPYQKRCSLQKYIGENPKGKREICKYTNTVHVRQFLSKIEIWGKIKIESYIILLH